MFFPLIALWALVGWCGTVPRPPFPPQPDPDPWPIYFVARVIGVVSGIVGGWAYSQVFLPSDPVPWRSAVFAATTSVGAYVAANVITDIYGQIRGRR